MQRLGHSAPGRPPQSSPVQPINLLPVSNPCQILDIVLSPVTVGTSQQGHLTGCSVTSTVQDSTPAACTAAPPTQETPTQCSGPRKSSSQLPISSCKQDLQITTGPAVDLAAGVPIPQPEPVLPFIDEEDCSLLSSSVAAKPLVKPSSLADTFLYLQSCTGDKPQHVFMDKKLPACTANLSSNADYSLEYFVTLHKLAAAQGPHYPAGTPNHMGSRLPLRHTKLKLDRWRHHLTGYDGVDICQLLEYGFPIGLAEDPPPKLSSTMRNHGSAIQYYTHIDKFIETGLQLCDVVGPCACSPFDEVHISPLMTAPKKPDSRRAVFDATFGDFSLNNGTPCDQYLGQPISFSYPKIEDFKMLVLKMGNGCYIWKRDLSRYFLQIPLDPIEYDKVGFVWRGSLFFFTGLMFGLRHAGLQGQKITTAISWIHQRLGLETDYETKFSSINYSDDIGGGERTLDRATESYTALAELLQDLGLSESTSKAHAPSTSMPYLGVNFDTVRMEMSIPVEKLTEVRELLGAWSRKTKATKKGLQQLLGKLFWVSRCVKFSRGFMARLLNQLADMHCLPDNKKVPISEECRLDIKWWSRYIRRFNGIECMYPDDPMDLSLGQLLDSSALVNCGDAQPLGGGSYFGSEYWSRPFPRWLQDTSYGIHIKEFWVALVSAWLWGEKWRGKIVYVFCDNVAVVETLDKQKPSDTKLQELLREYMYVVCTRGFTPKFRTIGTKENEVADYISRRHDPVAAAEYFASHGLPQRTLVDVPDSMFKLHSNW